MKPHDPNAPIPKPQPPKRQVEELSEREKEKKKKKGEKWMEGQKARADDVKGKKSAWDKFGKKAQKKGIHISGWVKFFPLIFRLDLIGLDKMPLNSPCLVIFAKLISVLRASRYSGLRTV